MLLAYYEEFATKEEAMHREWEIKQMDRQEKLLLIERQNRPEGCTEKPGGNRCVSTLSSRIGRAPTVPYFTGDWIFSGILSA